MRHYQKTLWAIVLVSPTYHQWLWRNGAGFPWLFAQKSQAAAYAEKCTFRRRARIAKVRLVKVRVTVEEVGP